MTQELLAAARQQAENSVPPVKAAALLHIARVLTTVNLNEAERVLEGGLALAATLSSSDKEIILSEGLCLAGAIVPERALRMLKSAPRRREPHRAIRLVRVMLDHGHLAQTIDFLSDPTASDEYPLEMVPNVIHKCSDDATRLRVLRAAISFYKEHGGRHFTRLFSRFWGLLPREEALQLTREILARILREPDRPTQARIANEVEFTSAKEFQLFEILNVLRQLEPDTTESLLRMHQQLAAAAARYPLGIDSLMAEHPPRTPAPGTRPGYIVAAVGTRADVARQLAMIEAEQEGDFEPRFQEALRLYAKDNSPASFNHAPKECWPSTQEFRNLLYAVGKRRDADAPSYLERIPDRDIRLLAMIELSAALAGLPLLTGTCRIRPSPD